MRNPISLDVIIQANAYWSHWFDKRTVPGLVDPDVMSHTCPPGAHDDRLYGSGMDTVVASAEQSFLQLEKDGDLEPGRWMALTPCYRDEPVYDETHLPVFLKLELICLAEKDNFYTRSDAQWLAGKMQVFFKGMYGMPTEVIETEEGFDVMYGDLELGSYGVRKTMKGASYVYGTGVAEPRASLAIRRYYESIDQSL